MLGTLYWQGRGVTRSPVRAVELVGQACQLGEKKACVNLEETLALLDRACQSGANESCYLLGGLYWTGRGVSPQLARAIPLLTRACDGGASCRTTPRPARRS